MAKRHGNRKTEHFFSQIPKANIQRSQFNRSHTHKTTFDGGHLVPILVDEILPGDTWNLQMTAFARLATPVYPIMDNMHMDFFFFFVPNRLVWSNWQKFCGEQDDPGDSTDYVIPQVIAHSSATGHGLLHDYMGVPPTNALSVSALPMRCYGLIWNEWFRDQNLQNALVISKGNGPDQWDDFGGLPLSGLQSRGKRHDYFSSSLPWPSKGPGVEIPLGESAAVTITGQAGEHPSFDIGSASDKGLIRDPNAGYVGWESGDPASGGTTPAEWNDPALEGQVDLSTATAATINTLRQAFQIQKLFERDARGGTRYTEIVKSHFQVTSPDARLQRSEYLSGGTIPVNISQVSTTAHLASPLNNIGDLHAYGIAVGGPIGFNKSFVEHGHIIGLVSVRADLTYQQGINRMWSRETRYDFYWPVFQNLGEQAVLNQEIYVQNPSVGAPDPDNLKVWGYQERWAEYRYCPSRVSALFRSSATGDLDEWHLAQLFPSLPTLGSTFITDTPPIDRVIAVNTEPHFIFDSFFNIKCARPMPVYSVPGLIDHF